MKRYILLVILIFVLGASVIIVPRVISSNQKSKVIADKQSNEISKLKILEQIQSNPDTIQDSEHVQKEKEFYDPSQMYFENIEVLYDHLKFSQVDDVKQKIQFYIHSNIDNQILDCYLDKDSLKDENDTISFNISFGVSNMISVIINKSNNGETLDISVFDSL